MARFKAYLERTVRYAGEVTVEAADAAEAKRKINETPPGAIAWSGVTEDNIEVSAIEEE